MKIPKELKNVSKISTSNKKKQIFINFRRSFIKLNNKFKPRYSVVFLKMGQTGKYSDMVYQWLKGYGNLDKKDFILMAKEFENIEFYINWERLGKTFLKGKLFYDLENYFEFYKKLYQQCAYHEYGHTYLITSTSTMLYPNEALKFLKDNNLKDILSIPETKQTEFNRVIENSKQNRINQHLKNTNFIDIANGVLECHANYMMKNHLKLDSPIEFLKFSKVDLLDGLYDYNKFNINEMDKEYINTRVKNWLIKANDLFVFNKLDTMKKSCEKYGFLALFDFAYDLNNKFLEIVKNHEDVAEMKDEILALAVETNKLNFIDMFFQ
jgi:hypothetical protein